jgi:DNA polymerase-3 subunit chi
MTEVLFYELDRRPLESVLPELLQRSRDRGWRVVVKVGSEERLETLNGHLWSFDEASFLPHGSASDGRAEAQPIWLTVGDDNPNRAQVRFLVDGAAAEGHAGYDRVVFLFDTADAAAVARTRLEWQAARTAGHETTYWRQDEKGRWTRQA